MPASRLRQALAAKEFLMAPGAYDCITAKLIEQAGFPLVYMSGGCTAAMLGFPDYGLTTMSEMADNAGRIAGAVGVPVIADADTGFGNELNIFRTIREYELRGVAGIQIEDQVFPKTCGHLDGKEIVPREEFVSKVRTAAAARRNPDTVIIARTDARSVVGFEEAVARMNLALEAGADVAFLEAPCTIEEIEDTPRLIKGPCLLNVVRGGKSPVPDLARVAELGYAIAIVPGILLQHIMGACDDILHELRETRAHPVPRNDISIKDMFARVGSGDWDRLRREAPAVQTGGR